MSFLKVQKSTAEYALVVLAISNLALGYIILATTQYPNGMLAKGLPLAFFGVFVMTWFCALGVGYNSLRITKQHGLVLQSLIDEVMKYQQIDLKNRDQLAVLLFMANQSQLESALAVVKKANHIQLQHMVVYAIRANGYGFEEFSLDSITVEKVQQMLS